MILPEHGFGYENIQRHSLEFAIGGNGDQSLQRGKGNER
jgi:hypothetical protein